MKRNTEVMQIPTRTVKVGKCKVIIQNVPDDVTDDQLYSLALMKLYEMSKDKATQEIQGRGVAS